MGKKVSETAVRWQKCTCPLVSLIHKQNHATDITKPHTDSPLLECKSYYKQEEGEEGKGRGEEEEQEEERKEYCFHNIPPLSNAK